MVSTPIPHRIRYMTLFTTTTTATQTIIRMTTILTSPTMPTTILRPQLPAVPGLA